MTQATTPIEGWQYWRQRDLAAALGKPLPDPGKFGLADVPPRPRGLGKAPMTLEASQAIDRREMELHRERLADGRRRRSEQRAQEREERHQAEETRRAVEAEDLRRICDEVFARLAAVVDPGAAACRWLGVDPQVGTDGDIQGAFRQRARAEHPDRGGPGGDMGHLVAVRDLAREYVQRRHGAA